MKSFGTAPITTEGDDGAAGSGGARGPGGGGRAKRARWYKRRAWLVSVTLVAVVGVTVLTDLPQHTSRSGQISDDSGVMTQVNKIIEGWVRARPEQWLWLHRRWR